MKPIRFHNEKSFFYSVFGRMDAPSPEQAPPASAPTPPGLAASGVGASAVALEGALAPSSSDSLVSNSNGLGVGIDAAAAAASSQRDELSFDETAACVGLGLSPWTCFKKELPDSQIATR